MEVKNGSSASILPRQRGIQERQQCRLELQRQHVRHNCLNQSHLHLVWYSLLLHATVLNFKLEGKILESKVLFSDAN